MLLSLEEKWGVVLTVAVVYEFINMYEKVLCVKGGPCLLIHCMCEMKSDLPLVQ